MKPLHIYSVHFTKPNKAMLVEAVSVKQVSSYTRLFLKVKESDFTVTLANEAQLAMANQLGLDVRKLCLDGSGPTDQALKPLYLMMKDHEIAEFVNRLTKIAKEHGSTHQCVRELIAVEVRTTFESLTKGGK